MAGFAWRMLLRGNSKNKSLSKALVPALFMHKMSTDSNIKSEKLTKGLELRFQEKKADNKDEKSLILLFCWMMAKKRHVDKYGDFYINKGCDVLNIRIEPLELMFPVKGAQVIASQVLSFLHESQQYPKILVHGFSVGGYLYGECLLKMINDARYQKIEQRIVGQIFDSAADFEHIPIGLARALFKNKIMVNVFRNFMENYMKFSYNYATKHYRLSSKTYHNNPVNCPSLFFYSRDDPVGTAEGNERVIRNWEKMGHRVYYKCWDSSPHVSHYHKHTEEYLKLLNNFLEEFEIFGPHPSQEIKYKYRQKI